MGRNRISVDALADTVMRELNDYADLAREDMKEAVKKAGDTVKSRYRPRHLNRPEPMPKAGR